MVVAAARIGLAAIAITDHDTVSALAIARPEAVRWQIELITGVELTCWHAGREIHILGHLFRDDDVDLICAMMWLRAGRAKRIEAMATQLEALGLAIDLDVVRRMFPRATLGRRHLADYLMRTRQIGSLREAFTRYIGDGCPACVEKPRLDSNRAITLVRDAGGTAALAHPPHDLAYSELKELVDDGLQAIEVGGPGFSRNKIQRMRSWASKLGLVGIAGSDFHCADRPGRWIGAITTSGEDLARLRQACK